MKELPKNPQLYEINTRPWLASLSRQAGRRLTLAQIPQQEWERLRSLGRCGDLGLGGLQLGLVGGSRDRNVDADHDREQPAAERQERTAHDQVGRSVV